MGGPEKREGETKVLKVIGRGGGEVQAGSSGGCIKKGGTGTPITYINLGFKPQILDHFFLKNSPTSCAWPL